MTQVFRLPDRLPQNEYTRDPQFSERDAEVLRFLGEEDLLGFTFEGLRRRLGTHSETFTGSRTSRSSRRLPKAIT
jgi:hypothetical protein